MTQTFAIPDSLYALATAGLDPARVKVVMAAQVGPLPVSASVTVERPNQLWLFCGSCFSAGVGPRSVDLKIDGAFVAASPLYFNPVSTHLPTIPNIAKTALGIGSHTVQIASGAGSPSSDGGDWYTVLLIELENVQQMVQAATLPPVVTALPTSPVDGQECYFVADAANGIKWHLKYNASSSSAYKWEYLGGPPLTSTLTPVTARPVLTAAWAAVPNVPTITMPLAGDFWIGYGYLGASNAAGGWGGVHPQSTVNIINIDTQARFMSSTAGQYGGNRRRYRFNGLPATLIQMQGLGLGTTVADIDMDVLPIRVG
jgi:hypothetical protein